MFDNWQKYWYVLHPFFYRGNEKEKTRSYLAELSKQLLKELNLFNYTYTCFDFLGPNNYGDTRCWIALYPIQKISHKEAYQLL